MWRLKLVPTGPDGPFSVLTFVWLCLCLSVTLYNCSVGHSDCSRCHTADHKYGCVWCGGAQASCLYSQSCSEPVQHTCPAPVIHTVSGDWCSGLLLNKSKSFLLLNLNLQTFRKFSALLVPLRLNHSLACWKVEPWWPYQAPIWARRLKTSSTLCQWLGFHAQWFPASTRFPPGTNSTCAGVLAEVTELNRCSTLPFVLQDCVQNRSQWWGEFRTGVC